MHHHMVNPGWQVADVHMELGSKDYQGALSPAVEAE